MSMLDVKNIHKRFNKTEVLKGIDFKLDKGEVLAIIGSSGSGKTTLLRCLTFLERAEIGSIYVDGEVIFDASDDTKLSLAEQRRRQLNFGLVFQSFNLFPQYSAIANVSLAQRLIAKELPDYRKNKKAINEEIEENSRDLLVKVGLAQKMNHYPWQLSGGQQQRVAIARALALNPKILCFDEPTSALDPELTGEVLKVIRSLKSDDSTMIIVTHEMGFAHDIADNVIFMDSGIITEQGPPDILTNPKSERLRTFLKTSVEN